MCKCKLKSIYIDNIYKDAIVCGHTEIYEYLIKISILIKGVK